MLLESILLFEMFTAPRLNQQWSCYNVTSRFTRPVFIPRAAFNNNELLFFPPDHTPIQIFITKAGFEWPEASGIRTSTVIIYRDGPGEYTAEITSGAEMQANIRTRPVKLWGFNSNFCDYRSLNTNPSEPNQYVWMFFVRDTRFATNNRIGWSHGCSNNGLDKPCWSQGWLQFWEQSARAAGDDKAFKYK